MTIVANDTVSTSEPASAPARTAARIGFAGACLSVVLLATLHVLRSDLDPAWHVLSEYAVGPYGWVIALYFLSFTVGYAGLFIALLPRVKTIGGRIGLVFLVAAAVGLAMAAMFPIDPIATAPEDSTFAGMMHGYASMIGITGQIVSALVLGYALGRKAPWAAVRRPLLIAGHVGWIGVVLMFVSLAVLIQQQAMTGPFMIGWANRLLMLAYSVWIMLAAWPPASPGRK